MDASLDTGMQDTGMNNDTGVAPDAGPSDSGLVATAVFHVQGAPFEGAEVVFHDSTGAVVETGATDNLGAATGPMTAGGMMTVKLDVGGSFLAQTVAGLDPGETILFGTEADPVVTSVGDVEIQILESFAGADHYEVDFGCGGNVFVTEPPVPTTTTLFEDCLGDSGLASAIATARDIDGNILAIATATDIMLGSAATIVSFARLAAAFETYTLDVTGAPAASEAIETELRLRRDGLTFEGQQASGPLAAGTSTAIVFAEPMSFGNGVEVLTSLSYDATSPGSFSVAVHRVDSTSRTFALDLSTELLPRVFGSSVAVGADTVVSWSTASPSDADAIVVRVLLDAPDSGWSILVPPSTPSPLELPALPQGFLPSVSAAEPPAVIYLELEPIADYAAFRDVYAHRIFNGGAPPGTRVRFSAVNFR
jgi:hypothetical protein